MLTKRNSWLAKPVSGSKTTEVIYMRISSSKKSVSEGYVESLFVSAQFEGHFPDFKDL